VPVLEQVLLQVLPARVVEPSAQLHIQPHIHPDIYPSPDKREQEQEEELEMAQVLALVLAPGKDWQHSQPANQLGSQRRTELR